PYPTQDADQGGQARTVEPADATKIHDDRSRVAEPRGDRPYARRLIGGQIAVEPAHRRCHRRPSNRDIEHVVPSTGRPSTWRPGFPVRVANIRSECCDSMTC